MTRLPQWCANPLGRALIAEIISQRPEPVTINHRLPAMYGGYPDGASTTYVGKPASLLRRLRSEWEEREFDRLNRAYASSKTWDEAASRAVLGAEEANDLITRVLGEQVTERRAA